MKWVAHKDKAGQGRARVRTLNTQEVINHLKKMIKSLDSLVPKTYQSGVKISYVEGAEKYPRAYKFIPEGTAIKMLKREKTYYVTIERDNCNFNHVEKYEINLFNASKKDEIEKGILKKAIQKLQHATGAEVEELF